MIGDQAVLEGSKSAVVMVVDDEPTTLDVIEMFLHGEGYREIVKLTDSRKALDLLAGVQPDVLLLNLMMPQVSGLEILAAMQRQESLRTIPVLIVTGSSDASLKREAFELGAADFLAKPIDPTELTLRLRNTLASRGYREGAPRAEDEARPPLAPPARARPDRDRIRAIVDAFMARLRPRLDAVEASLGAGDLPKLASLAHWLKGAAGTVGLHEFTEPAEALGRLAREGRPDEIGAVICRLRELVARIDGGAAD